MIEMIWKKNFSINRNWKKFISNDKWVLNIDEDLKEIAIAYWFKETKKNDELKSKAKK